MTHWGSFGDSWMYGDPKNLWISTFVKRKSAGFGGIENDDRWDLTLDVPGVRSENLKVTLRGHLLKAAWTRGSVSGSADVELDDNCEVAKVDFVELDHGVLRVRVPKRKRQSEVDRELLVKDV